MYTHLLKFGARKGKLYLCFTDSCYIDPNVRYFSPVIDPNVRYFSPVIDPNVRSFFSRYWSKRALFFSRYWSKRALFFLPLLIQTCVLFSPVIDPNVRSFSLDILQTFPLLLFRELNPEKEVKLPGHKVQFLYLKWDECKSKFGDESPENKTKSDMKKWKLKQKRP